MRPNILWITLDSLRANALPQYGNPWIRAPHIQRVAERGVVIAQAHCQMPKCVPSRPSQLTGRYPHCEGLRTIFGRENGQRPGAPLTVTRGMPNLFELLKGHGYLTCHTGTNHLLDWEFYNDPQLMDVTTDWTRWKRCRRPPQTCQDPRLVRAQYGGVIPPNFDIGNSFDAEATRQMGEFLDTRPSEPFFAYLDLRAPHPAYRDWPGYAEWYRDCDPPIPARAPIGKAPDCERAYREAYQLEEMPDADWRVIGRAYASAISFNDALVGQILDRLERNAQMDNTILVIGSDHGDFAGEHGCVEKHDFLLYDSLTRLPLIMSLPSTLRQDWQADILVEMVDLAPTLCELAEVEVPRWMQGKSFAPVLSGEREDHREDVICQGGVEHAAVERLAATPPGYFARPPATRPTLKQQIVIDNPWLMERARMLRTRDHKLIWRLNGAHEFYDLRSDPDELANRFADPAAQASIQQCQQRLLTRLMDAETNLPLLDNVWV